MYQFTPRITFNRILEGNSPQAVAWVTGNRQHPQLSGLVKFFTTPYGGTLVEAEFFGLPNASEPLSADYYAMHIHENGDCSQNFSRTGDHFNPTGQLHPAHVGDLPPLLANQGYAWTSFYNKRFTPQEIIGRSVIIHVHADDFMTQPSGNAGEKIGCGVILTQ